MALYQSALDEFLASPESTGWRDLAFFRDRAATRILATVDQRAKLGAEVLPAPGDVFNAFRLTPLDRARVVVLGQDPYPTPGHAHGLAFSYVGCGALPASLRNIFKELASDVGGPPRTRGDLTDWARQGVLLLNPALTVEAGAAGAHLKLGWQALAREAVAAVAQRGGGKVFLMWGEKARSFRDAIDDTRHLAIESAHPSPFSARNGFFGSRPFSRTNDFLSARGDAPIAW
jgi:uracil-DNA glycosylase